MAIMSNAPSPDHVSTNFSFHIDIYMTKRDQTSMQSTRKTCSKICLRMKATFLPPKVPQMKILNDIWIKYGGLIHDRSLMFVENMYREHSIFLCFTNMIISTTVVPLIH